MMLLPVLAASYPYFHMWQKILIISSIFFFLFEILLSPVLTCPRAMNSDPNSG